MKVLETAVRSARARAVGSVCGMRVEPGGTKLFSVHKGQAYWFCAEACCRAFEAWPQPWTRA